MISYADNKAIVNTKMERNFFGDVISHPIVIYRMKEKPNTLLLLKTSVAGHSPFTKGGRGIYE